jgi:cysteine-rich repeat protein
MRRTPPWVFFYLFVSGCSTEPPTDGGECNDNHVCEPNEHYKLCPQDCYWHPDGAEVIGKQSQPDGETWPGMAPAPGETFERSANGVCELRENWRFSTDCEKSCGDGVQDDEEALTCLADTTLARAASECDSDGLCEFQDNPALGDLLTAEGLLVPEETPYNCPLDCTPMGPDPIPNIFIMDLRGNGVCDIHENHASAPAECAPGCHDGCCSADDTARGCADDCAPDAPICPCADDACLGHCGNGTIDPGEQCDDGNSDDTDACPSTCQSAICGDGFIQHGVEQCDDANASNNVPCLNCMPASQCGNGMVNDNEDCDDGNLDNTDACLNTCKTAYCGDGMIHHGIEECDDANKENSDACLDTCEPAVCGDGFIQAGVEQCDDGNAASADACIANCKLATCGDGLIQTGVEECDDGNTEDTDACSNTCFARRLVFIAYPTQLQDNAYQGDLGGVVGADKVCQTHAKAAGLMGTFQAWLTENDRDTAPAKRFNSTAFTGWYIGTNGTLIAHGWTDLTTLDDNGTTYIKSPIRFDEYALPIEIDSFVWTNTGPDGEQDPRNLHCNNWTSGKFADYGAPGVSTLFPQYEPTSAIWTMWDDGGEYECVNTFRLYCFQTNH